VTIVWSPQAVDDVAAAVDYLVERHADDAARKLVDRVTTLVERLAVEPIEGPEHVLRANVFADGRARRFVSTTSAPATLSSCCAFTISDSSPSRSDQGCDNTQRVAVTGSRNLTVRLFLAGVMRDHVHSVSPSRLQTKSINRARPPGPSWERSTRAMVVIGPLTLTLAKTSEHVRARACVHCHPITFGKKPHDSLSTSEGMYVPFRVLPAEDLMPPGDVADGHRLSRRSRARVRLIRRSRGA
jgi:plasmid stabilization system protein ParE